jgi:hypothetical protein
MSVNSNLTASQQNMKKLPISQLLSHLSPVSLTPVINLSSRILPRIFVKIRNGTMIHGILRGPAETDLLENTEVENLVSDSL